MKSIKLKKETLKIESCFECPFQQYDPYYDMTSDSGHDCQLSIKRIIDDKCFKRDYNQKTLPIPDWCELAEYKMDCEELLNYIKNRKYYCCFCGDLQRKVLENGLEEIDKYDGMICGGVEDMFVRRGRW